MLVLVLLLTIGFVALTSATGLTERLLTTDAEDGRFVVYPAIVEGIQDRPWLGHGLGAFHEAFRPYTPFEAAFGEWVRAHSSYLENAFELGLPAAGALYLALALIAWRIRRGTILRREGRAFPAFALACIAAGAFHSIFDFSLQMPAAAALFAAILGLGWAQSFTRSELKVKRRDQD